MSSLQEDQANGSDSLHGDYCERCLAEGGAIPWGPAELIKSLRSKQPRREMYKFWLCDFEDSAC